jgi:hypothetical protein
MLQVDFGSLQKNVASAETDDLLDRVTVYRDELIPEAISLILEELVHRGIRPTDVESYRLRLGPVLRRDDGTVRVCSFCRKPATASGWGWHYLFKMIPVFPRYLWYCHTHLEVNQASTDSDAETSADVTR